MLKFIGYFSLLGTFCYSSSTLRIEIVYFMLKRFIINLFFYYFFSKDTYFSICSLTHSSLFYSLIYTFSYIYLYFIKSFSFHSLVINEFLIIFIKPFEIFDSSRIFSTYVIYNNFLSIYFNTFTY